MIRNVSDVRVRRARFMRKSSNEIGLACRYHTLVTRLANM